MIKIFGPHTKIIKNGKYTNFKGQMKEFDGKMDLMMAFQNLELFMGIKFKTRQTQRLPRTIVAFLRQKWPIIINFQNNLPRNTVSKLYSNIPLF